MPLTAPQSSTHHHHYDTNNHHHRPLSHYQQQQQQNHHHHEMLETPRSMHLQKARTMTTVSSTSSSSSGSPSGSATTHMAEVLYQGYLMTKRGLLKGLEKDYYFVMRGSADLYYCKSESLFGLWYKSSKGDVESAASKTSSLAPTHVCSVLRADRAGDSGGSDRGIVVVAAPASGSSAFAKPTTLKFVAETNEKCERWIRALHHVQLTRRSSNASSEPKSDTLASQPSTPASNTGSGGHAHHQQQNHYSQEYVSSPHHFPRARQLSRSESDSRGHGGNRYERKSSSSSEAASEVAPANPRSNALLAAAMVAPTNQGNVLLFVPAAGSAISVSDSKLALARKQAAELAAKGVKRPMCSGMESSAYNHQTQWRYGTPEYALSDLEYMKHKQREHESTPLESYVEECCQTFLMEATHKANYNEWVSVRQEYFYLQVNDGQHVSGYGIAENDMFGLLYMPGFEVADADVKEGEEKDPRAILAEVFTEGFPMEVLEVYTQPPQCYFSWRHWGPFTGSYKGVKGDGSRIEVRGFGQMQIDSNRMLSLRLFFKTKELFDKLNTVSAVLAQKAQEVEKARSKSTAGSIASSSAAAAAASATSSRSAASPARSAAAPATRSTPAQAPQTRAPAPTPPATLAAAPAPASTAAPHPSRAGRTAPKSKAQLRAEIMGELANPSTTSATAPRT